MGDPGTIYSDDEIDCLSNSDDDTVRIYNYFILVIGV